MGHEKREIRDGSGRKEGMVGMVKEEGNDKIAKKGGKRKVVENRAMERSGSTGMARKVTGRIGRVATEGDGKEKREAGEKKEEEGKRKAAGDKSRRVEERGSKRGDRNRKAEGMVEEEELTVEGRNWGKD
ncbi:hypothetical protein ACH5RR_026385 [Cinchona calisaya]|uniref:Uncharacterized protein n=1 Tax=Cinchona calisaya TaxID=153742 RepID=A0ABD2Z3H9_9GENT